MTKTIEPLAELKGVSKRYGKIVALDNFDLAIERGEVLSLLGQNGAGKSTAIGMLLGLRKPDSGTVRLFGQPPRLVDARRHVGVLMQEVWPATELRVRELIDLFASYYAQPLGVDEVLELTDTTALAERRYGRLSGGQKRQVQFAMAICGRPQLLFLDEPTVGLDVKAREILWRSVRNLVADGCSVVLTTHYLDEAAALATRVVVMAKGRIVRSGSVEQIRGHVVSKRVICASSLSVEEVASWEDVQSVSRDQHRLQLLVSNAEAVVARLLATDKQLTELEVHRAGLAEALNQIAKEVA